MLPALTQSVAYHDVIGQQGDTQVYSLEYTLKHPLKTLLIIMRSAVVQLRVLVFMFIGNRLGHLCVPVPSAAVLIFGVLMLFSVLPTEDDADIRVSGRRRLSLIGLCVLTVVICYYGMLLWWTPMSSNVILGVQGRYFTPVFPLLSLALRLPVKHRFSGGIWLLAVSGITNVYALWSVFVLLKNAVI